MKLSHLSAIVVGACLSVCSIASAQLLDPPRVEIEWTVRASQVDEARDALKFDASQISGDPASVEPTKGLPLVYILAGIVAIPDFANAIVNVYKKAWYGTTILSCDSNGLCKIDHDPKGTDDTIIIRKGTDVNVEIHNRQSLDASKWLEILAAAIRGK